jgi:hypothetical protein
MAIDKAGLRTIEALQRALKKMPFAASQRIAARWAPEATNMAGSAYDAGKTVYDEPRKLGVNGNELDLVRTGASRRATRFIADGASVRTAPLPPYTKYLIGKYEILPQGRGRLPPAWRERITHIASQVLYAELQATGGKVKAPR